MTYQEARLDRLVKIEAKRFNPKTMQGEPFDREGKIVAVNPRSATVYFADGETMEIQLKHLSYVN